MKIVISPFSQKLRNGKENPKNYPYWPELITILRQSGIDPIQVGVKGEPELTENTKFNLSLPELKEFIQDMDLFISVDNFFPHFCHHYGKKGVVLFSRSNPMIYGYQDNLNIFKDQKYFRKDQFGIWESCEYLKEAFVTPDVILRAINNV